MYICNKEINHMVIKTSTFDQRVEWTIKGEIINDCFVSDLVTQYSPKKEKIISYLTEELSLNTQFQQSLPINEEMSWNSDFFVGYAFPSSNPFQEDILKKCKMSYELNSGLKLKTLEFGSGLGFTTWKQVLAGCDVSTNDLYLDKNEETIDKNCREKAGALCNEITKYPGDLFQFEDKTHLNGTFDIISSNCLIHFFGPDTLSRFFKLSYNLLNEKGQLYITANSIGISPNNEKIEMIKQKQAGCIMPGIVKYILPTSTILGLNSKMLTGNDHCIKHDQDMSYKYYLFTDEKVIDKPWTTPRSFASNPLTYKYQGYQTMETIIKIAQDNGFHVKFASFMRPAGNIREEIKDNLNLNCPENEQFLVYYDSDSLKEVKRCIFELPEDSLAGYIFTKISGDVINNDI